jgi:hypothetical protein
MTGAIPLTAAMLAVAVSPAAAPDRYGAFRALLAGLIVLSAAGVAFSTAIAGVLMGTYTALIGVARRPDSLEAADSNGLNQ